ncbi:MAG: redox-sensitive transcriptional activator SoxR [Pseudomonadota bacterium]
MARTSGQNGAAAKPTGRMLGIGDLAARTGLSVSAIRFYEDKGLVAPLRTSGNQRRFLRADIRRLSFIQIAQQLGFSIAEIRQQLEKLPLGRAPTRKDWARISAGFRDILDSRIALMQKTRERLDGCIGCGCLSLDTCALYNPDDRAHRFGTGPRWLIGADSERDAVRSVRDTDQYRDENHEENRDAHQDAHQNVEA